MSAARIKKGWLGRLLGLSDPLLPSDYIAKFLNGEISADQFASNIGDGWIGSDLDDQSWLDQVYDLERRYNPDFPSVSLTALTSEVARSDLNELMFELRSAGK